MNDCLDKPIDWFRLDAALARFAPAPVADIEKGVLANLRTALGVDEARQLLEDGIQAYRSYCDAIERDIETPSAVALHAHKIKGSAGTLGLAALTKAAAAVEGAALTGEGLLACVSSLRATLEAAHVEIAMGA
jgi:HPt (histidine-containing phosphotransfer) domain-containing protein